MATPQNFISYTKNLLERKEEWTLYFRKELLHRNNNTNNVCEAAMKVFKDKVLFSFVLHFCSEWNHLVILMLNMLLTSRYVLILFCFFFILNVIWNLKDLLKIEKKIISLLEDFNLNNIRPKSGIWVWCEHMHALTSIADMCFAFKSYLWLISMFFFLILTENKLSLALLYIQVVLLLENFIKRDMHSTPPNFVLFICHFY